MTVIVGGYVFKTQARHISAKKCDWLICSSYITHCIFSMSEQNPFVFLRTKHFKAYQSSNGVTCVTC